MPIYEYRCSSCGHEKEVLQKMSDAPLSECPACGKSTFRKLISAAGFQLKGSGWYATDFKGGAKPAASEDKGKSEAGGEPVSKGAAGSKAEAKPGHGAGPKPESVSKESRAKEEPKSGPPASGSGAKAA